MSLFDQIKMRVKCPKCGLEQRCNTLKTRKCIRDGCNHTFVVYPEKGKTRISKVKNYDLYINNLNKLRGRLKAIKNI